jgi:Aerotolerance regulator N-terminal/von Willebrand factor type A domain
MTFVYPLLLGGLLLAGLPVLLHFLIRQKPKTLLFPAYRFLLLKRRSNTRNLRLRHLLLLLLRIALIALICFALARPRLFHPLAEILDRERPVAMIFVIDTTPSMDYKSGDQTRLELAKTRALELLDQLPADGRFLVLDAADLASSDREDFVASADKARQRIQSLTIRPESVPVTTALIKALDRFDSWDDPSGQKLPRFVCVFTDRTKPSWDGPALTKRLAKEDSVKVQTLLFDVGVAEPVDFAILQADLPSEQQTFLEGEKIPLRVVVKATGKSSDNTLLLRIDGKEALKQSVSVPAGESQTLTFAIATDSLKLGPGYHQAEVVESTLDALPFNNQRFVTFFIKEKPRVLVLADDLTTTRPIALSLKDLNYDVDHKTPKDAGDLGAYQAIFLVSVAAPDDKLWQSLKAYVDGGRGLAVVPGGEELQPNAYNSPDAQKVLPGTLGAHVKSKQGAIWNLLESNLQHSFMQLFRLWIERGNVGFIDDEPRHAFQYWEVKPQNEENVIVAYDQNPRPAVLEKKLGGKVLLLTTPMDDRASEWNDYGKKLAGGFRLALLMMCTRHLCIAAEQQPRNFQFGVRPPVVTKSDRAFAKYTLEIGQTSEDIGFDEKNVWRGNRLTKAGNYAIFGTNPDQNETALLAKFSVNTPGNESDLSRVPNEEIEALLGKKAVVPQDRTAQLNDALNWNEPLELFPWLMIGLLFLLAFENLLANKFYRQEPASES